MAPAATPMPAPTAAPLPAPAAPPPAAPRIAPGIAPNTPARSAPPPAPFRPATRAGTRPAVIAYVFVEPFDNPTPIATISPNRSAIVAAARTSDGTVAGT